MLSAVSHTNHNIKKKCINKWNCWERKHSIISFFFFFVLSQPFPFQCTWWMIGPIYTWTFSLIVVVICTLNKHIYMAFDCARLLNFNARPRLHFPHYSVKYCIVWCSFKKNDVVKLKMVDAILYHFRKRMFKHPEAF